MRDMVHEMFGPNTFCSVRLTSGERLDIVVSLAAAQFVGVWSAESGCQAVDLYGWFKARPTRILPAGFTQVWALSADALRAASDWDVAVHAIFNPRESQSSILSLAAVMCTACNDVASVKALLKARERVAARAVGYEVSLEPD